MSQLQQQIDDSQNGNNQDLTSQIDRQMYNIQLPRPERQVKDMYKPVVQEPDNFYHLKTEEQFQFIHEQISQYAQQQLKQLQILEDYCYTKISQVHDLIQAKEAQNQALSQKNNLILYKQISTCENAIIQDRNDIKKITDFQQQLQNADQAIQNQLEQLKQQLQAQFQDQKLQLYKEIETLKQQNLAEITQNINKAHDRSQEQCNMVKQEFEHNIKTIQDLFSNITSKLSNGQTDLETRQNKLANDVKEINQKIQNVFAEQTKFQQEYNNAQSKTSNSITSVEQNFTQQQIQIQNGFNAVKQIQKQQQDAILQLQNDMFENNSTIQGHVQLINQSLSDANNGIQSLEVKQNVLNEQLQQYKITPDEIKSRLQEAVQQQQLKNNELSQSLQEQQTKISVVESKQDQVQQLQNRIDALERELKEVSDIKERQKEIISEYLANILSNPEGAGQTRFWQRYAQDLNAIHTNAAEQLMKQDYFMTEVNKQNDEFRNLMEGKLRQLKNSLIDKIENQQQKIDQLEQDLKQKNDQLLKYTNEENTKLKQDLCEQFKKGISDLQESQSKEILQIQQQQDKLNEKHDIGAFKDEINNNVKEIQQNSEKILSKFDQTQKEQNKLLETTINETSKLILNFNNELDKVNQEVLKIKQENQALDDIEDKLNDTIDSKLEKFEISIKQFTGYQVDQQIKNLRSDNDKIFTESKNTQNQLKKDVKDISKILENVLKDYTNANDQINQLQGTLGKTLTLIDDKLDIRDKKCDKMYDLIQEQMLQVQSTQESVNTSLQQKYAKLSNNLQEQISRTLLDYQVQKQPTNKDSDTTIITSDVSHTEQPGENDQGQNAYGAKTFGTNMLKNILEQLKSIQTQFDQIRPLLVGDGAQGNLNNGILMQRVNKVEKNIQESQSQYRRLTSLLAPFVGTDLSVDPDNFGSNKLEKGFVTLFNATETKMLDLQQHQQQQFDEFTFNMKNMVEKVENQTKETVEQLSKGLKDQELQLQKQVDRVIQTVIPQQMQQLQQKIQDVKYQLKNDIQKVQEYSDSSANKKHEIIEQIIQLQLHPLNLKIDNLENNVQRITIGNENINLRPQETSAIDTNQGSQLQQIQKQIIDTQTIMAQYKQQLEQLSSNLDEYKKQMQNQTDKNMQETVKIQQEHKQVIDTKLRVLESKVDETDQRRIECVNICTVQVPNLIDQVAQLNKNFNGQILKMQNQIHELQSIEKEKHTCEHTQTITRLNSTVNQQTVHVQQLQDVQQKQQQLLDMKLLEFAQRESIVRTIQQQLQSYQTQFNVLICNIDEQLKGRIGKVEQESEQLGQQIQNYQSAYDKLTERINHIQHEQEQNLNNLRSELAKETQKLYELQTDSQNFREQQNQLNIKFTERLSEGAENLEKTVSNMKQKLQEKETHLNQQLKIRTDQCEQNFKLQLDQQESLRQEANRAFQETIQQELEQQKTIIDRKNQTAQEQRTAFQTQQLNLIHALKELINSTVAEFQELSGLQSRQNKEAVDNLQKQLTDWSEKSRNLLTDLQIQQKAALSNVEDNWRAMGDKVTKDVAQELGQVSRHLQMYSTHLNQVSQRVVDHRLEAQRRIDAVDARLLKLLDQARIQNLSVDDKLKTLETAFAVQQQQLDVIQTGHQQLEEITKKDKAQTDDKLGYLERQDEAYNIKLSGAIRDVDAKAAEALKRADYLKQELGARIDELLAPLANPLYIQSVDAKTQETQRPGVRFVSFDSGDQVDTEIKSMASGLRKALEQRGVQAQNIAIVKVKKGVYEAAGRRAQVQQARDALRVKTDTGSITFAEWLYDVMTVDK